MRLLRNALFNLVGGLVPAVASLLTVPVIVARLGADQYGVFTLVTAIVGYFAVFDINVTAGSVKFVAEHHARNEHDATNEVITFGGLIYLVIGLVGAVAIAVFAQFLVQHVFKVPAALHPESIRALRWAALGFLLSQMQVYLLSVPQALQRFDVAGRLEGLFGSLVPVVTLGVALLGGGLADIMAVRAALALLNCIVLVQAVRAIHPALQLRRPARDVMRRIASFSAYSYLSRLATITFLNADKLFIGALRDMTALAMYTVPFMLANRLFGVVGRLSAVLFPAASSMAARGDWDALRAAYLGATRYVVYLNACIAALLCLGARELLNHWAGKVFGQEAATVLVVISLAVFADTLTNIPSLVNDGLGQPRNSGLFALARAVLGIALGYLAVRQAGILGAAWAQLVISVVLAALFVTWIHRVHRATLGLGVLTLMRRAWLPAMALPAVVTAAGIAGMDRAPASVPVMLAAAAAVGIVFALWGWFGVLVPVDRERLIRTLERRRAGLAGATVEEAVDG